MNFQVEKLPKNTFKVRVTVAADEVNSLRDEALTELTKEVEVPGFRKGMAPKEMAASKIEKNRLRAEIINKSLNRYYPQVLKEARLAPIIYPRIEVIQLEENRDLVFDLTFCGKPEINLGDYRSSIRELKKSAAEKTILGADGSPLAEKNGAQENQRLERIFGRLIEDISFEVSDLLIEEEVNHMLTRLIDQTSKIGLTVETYLRNSRKTLDDLKAEYRRRAERDLKLEFILMEIAGAEEIEVSDQEIFDTIKAAPDEASRRELGKEENKSYVKSIILKNKVIERLVEVYEEDLKDGEKNVRG